MSADDSKAQSPEEQPWQNAIEAISLSKKFGDRLVVDQLSFTIKRGELYALLGDNGDGKTTTINMLTTLLSPAEGSFRICDYDGRREPEQCKRLFGVVSQDVAIYQELTAYENLKFVADLYGMPRTRASERISELLIQYNLADRANDQAGEFSMGMQRKLAIATAILHEPQVLFMDEPTVGLDVGSRRHIWETLKELRASGVTILLTTHYLEEAEIIADRIGIIRKGKLVLEGTIDELRRRIQGICGVMAYLSKHYAEPELQQKMESTDGHFPFGVEYDRIRNTISFLPVDEMELTESLRLVLEWLHNRDISFSKFTTSEPSLEQIFLTVTAGKAGVEGHGEGEAPPDSVE